jgi:hypothetical protein
MTAIKGSQKIIAMGLGDTFGTPVALATGARIEVESYNDSENTVELTQTPIGAGVVMQKESERGTVSPTIEVTAVAGYNDATVAAAAQFFGTTAVSSVVAGAHAHLLTINETFNTEWLTVADLKTTAEAVEYPSCAVTDINYAIASNDYMRMTMTLLGNLQDLAPTVNDADQLALTTVADATRVVVRPQHEFLINSQAGGALNNSTDLVSIVTAQIAFSKPQEHIHEIRGEEGNGEPDTSGTIPLEVTLTVERKNQPDISFMEAHQAGTEYKAAIKIEGPVITGTTPYAYELYFPRLKVVTPVDAGASSAGRNSETITFKALKAATNPTGMVSTYPYLRIVNAKATKYEA